MRMSMRSEVKQMLWFLGLQDSNHSSHASINRPIVIKLLFTFSFIFIIFMTRIWPLVICCMFQLSHWNLIYPADRLGTMSWMRLLLTPFHFTFAHVQANQICVVICNRQTGSRTVMQNGMTHHSAFKLEKPVIWCKQGYIFEGTYLHLHCLSCWFFSINKAVQRDSSWTIVFCHNSQYRIHVLQLNNKVPLVFNHFPADARFKHLGSRFIVNLPLPTVHLK